MLLMRIIVPLLVVDLTSVSAGPRAQPRYFREELPERLHGSRRVPPASTGTAKPPAQEMCVLRARWSPCSTGNLEG